ncbi:Transcriptional regulator prz1 [Hypsizygus marmoreus]|uniref:Transcriptional regulator prz1 n=1 Tax=Hypsizygus marmoreus TaxID=39966 RepID=A0A369JXY2_HYPMA|nr:Transcriptional regulator prz1 [Hypsizygus marmoreus]
MTDTQSEALVQINEPNEPEEWDEDDYDDEGDEDDDDIDAEAEEIARRLGEELWADISKASLSQAVNGPTIPLPDVPATPDTTTLAPPAATVSRKGEAAIATMRAVLALIENDPLAHSSLASAIIPNSNGDNVLNTLNRIMASGNISKAIALPLSHVLVSLARSEALFGNLRHSNASSIQLDKGKRKREETDDGLQQDPRVLKRPYLPGSDLQTQVNEAVRVITHAFGTSATQSLDPSLVSSIRLQLHQVFLFAVTSSAGGGHDMHALQEISGLIQVVGVLSGIQIGQSPGSHSQPPPHAFPPNPAYPWLSGQTSILPTDIGTAVYPCLVAGCRKTFSRLYSLRAHQRVHAMHRPFRCNVCPASFARNHDLKRHIKLHDKKAWKCGGCLKIFSRRDAIKRHKNGTKTRGPSDACLTAEVIEVELNEEEGEDSIREERRAKLWNGIATSQQGGTPGASATPHGHHDDSRILEEGEVQPAIICSIQSAILSLHGLLQAHVGNALGAPVGQAFTTPLDPTAGQATLASVIARAQLQNMPPKAAPATNLSNVPDAQSISAAQQSEEHVSVLLSDSVGLASTDPSAGTPSLSMYGLSDEQTKMLEEAIASAASAAQAQAEAEAALEEEEEDYNDDDDYDEESDGHAEPEQSQ